MIGIVMSYDSAVVLFLVGGESLLHTNDCAVSENSAVPWQSCEHAEANVSQLSIHAARDAQSGVPDAGSIAPDARALWIVEDARRDAPLLALVFRAAGRAFVPSGVALIRHRRGQRIRETLMRFDSSERAAKLPSIHLHTRGRLLSTRYALRVLVAGAFFVLSAGNNPTGCRDAAFHLSCDIKALRQLFRDRLCILVLRCSRTQTNLTDVHIKCETAVGVSKIRAF